VSTLTEAEFFADHGFMDILYPYPPSIDKIQRAHQLQKRVNNFYLSIDNPDVLEILLEYAQKHDTQFKVYIDIDPSENRSGIDTEDPLSLELVKKIWTSKYVTLHGLYVHAGHSYFSLNTSQISKIAQHERDITVKFATKLQENGIKVPIMAIGSTPTTVKHAENLSGINEIHPGNYTLFDTYQASIGTCSFDNCALTILTRVISRYKFPYNRLLIDAGAFALSKDRGPVHINNYKQYGVIVGHPELKITVISQEVAVVEGAEGYSFDVENFPVGTLLQVIPNHSCMSCYCYEKLHVLRGGVVVDQWTTCPRH